MSRKKLPNVKTQLYIDGKWTDGGKGTHPLHNPATGEEIAQISKANKEETQRAIDAAEKAFEEWSTWEIQDRVDMVHKIADLIEEDIDRIALIMTLEQGKPLDQAKVEVERGIEDMHWSAEEAKRTYGEIGTAPNGHKYEIKKHPIGVAAVITPWNFPFSMLTRKLGPALAAGSTVVVKPAAETPLSAIVIFELFEKAGLPAGVANLVMGDASKIGKVFTDSNVVRKLSFTGSTAVGKLLYEQSADTMKKLSLELGGHAPFLVFEDAPIQETVDTLVAMKFRNSGQACTAPNRIFVHESIKEEFTDALVKAVKDGVFGNGQDDGVEAGPLINQEAIDSIDDQLNDAEEKGAKILYGGGQLTDNDLIKGTFYTPTVIDDINEDMEIWREETFGPVFPLLSFSDEDEGLKRANDSDYGLTGYVFTKDHRIAEKFANALEYGAIGLNNTGVAKPSMPFGGFKHSGVNREGGHEGVDGYLETKFVHSTYFE